MKKNIYLTALVSQVLAVFTHAYLTHQHYNLKFGTTDGKRLCNVSDYFNCDSVAASIYSVLLGTPLALWGLITNALLLFLLISFSWSNVQNLLKRQTQILGTLIAIASVVMAVISVTMMQTACLFCIGTYIFSFITLVALFRINAENPVSFAEAVFKSLKVPNLKMTFLYIFAPVTLIFLLNSMIVTTMAKDINRIVADNLAAWKSGKDVNLSQASGLTLGADPAKAKMVIVEFADFQCVHCKMAAPILKSFTLSRKDVALIFQSFPLDGTCNPAVKHQADGKSCELAKAVYCATQQSKGWPLHEWIFENLGKVDLGQLSSVAQNFGIDVAAFNECRASSETSQKIIEQAKLGESIGIKGTPAIFANGRELPGGQFLVILEAAYNELSR